MDLSEHQRRTIEHLKANWVWVPDWVDSSPTNTNTAARIVRFHRTFNLESTPGSAILHFSADTRYKLLINGARVAVGPARGSPLAWYYDSLDVASHLVPGPNTVCFEVIRYFAASRGGMPFERNLYPGLTVVGNIRDANRAISLDSIEGWSATVDQSTLFPLGRPDDVFLHINEVIDGRTDGRPVTPIPYNTKTLNGELAPWRLRPRPIPMPEETDVAVAAIHNCSSDIPSSQWKDCLSGKASLTLPASSSHTLDVQADVHSTAFLRWVFKASTQSSISLKVVYSEGYEKEPRAYPFFRTKHDRLDAANGLIIGPWDAVSLNLPAAESTVYEPFWFRTFRVMRWTIEVGPEPVELVSFDAAQTNYPLDIKASWALPGDKQTEEMWHVSIRTMRNCMFDGYSDCPFYEQLQYAGDSRSVGIFHYLLTGDDRLMRQCISSFAASIGPDGLTQSRFPSHVPQVIAGFSLYWILQVCDHHLYFGDDRYARSFLPAIDGVLDFFDSHVDSLGLVSGLPEDVWQFVDWVTTWGATDTHPDKGVPTSGRGSNRHTYFSMLYAHTLTRAAQLTRDVGRPAYAAEYEARAASLVDAVRSHCYDGRFFTDSTVDVAASDPEDAYSQHCQVFAVLCGAAHPGDRQRLLRDSMNDARFSRCSYMMLFYALRAVSMAGGDLYDTLWATVWNPWRLMLANNLTTWEEDDVRQRSDCHAWGSVPIYEFCVELAGIHVVEPGARKVMFRPRLGLAEKLEAKVCLGRDNVAQVQWQPGDGNGKSVTLVLARPAHVVSSLDGRAETDHGIVESLDLSI